MAQIPYSPVPTVAPSEAPTPGFRLNTPEGAFGGGVAGATQGLGQSISSTGNELFGRAMAMQQLANESEAREADSNYMVAAGDLHAKYNSLQGKAAVDAYPEYTNNLKELRVQMRDGLSSQTSQKMFDAQSLGTMGRSIFNGAGHAASENKKYAIGTITAQMELDAKSVENDPKNETLFKDKLKRVHDGARELSALQGLDPGSPQEQALMLKATSKLWSQQIMGLSRTAPFEAAKALDANKTMMTQDDFLRVDGVVRTQGRAVGSANIANQVYNPDKTLKDMEADAKAEAKRLAPDDPLLAQAATSAVQTKFNQDKYAIKQQKLDDIQTYREGVAAGPTGRGVKTEQELLQMPGMAEVVSRLPASERNAISGYINRFNRARDQVTNDESKLRLNGLFNNPDTREEALNLDLTQEKLSMPDLMRFQDKQAKLLKDVEGDPRVGRAVGWMQQSMGTQLEALGVYHRTDANRDLYDKFRGSVQVGIDTFTKDNKHPPDYKEFMDQIAPRLLQTRDTSMIFGKVWPTNTPFFNKEGAEQVGLAAGLDKKAVKYDAFAQRLKDDFASKQLGTISEEEIEKAYIRAIYSKLYGKKDTAK